MSVRRAMPCWRSRHTVVTGHGQLQAADQRIAVHGHYDRPRGRFDAGQQIVEGFGTKVGQLEAGNVGARDMRESIPMDDECLGLLVGIESVERLLYAGLDRLRDRVEGVIGDTQEADSAASLIRDGTHVKFL